MITFRHSFLLFTIGWATVIYLLSSQPGLNVPPLFAGQDKILHAIVFGILGFFLLGAQRPADRGYRDRDILLTILLVMLYGISDEVHQLFVPGRSADFLDVVADTAGGILGVTAQHTLTRFWLRRQKNH